MSDGCNSGHFGGSARLCRLRTVDKRKHLISKTIALCLLGNEKCHKIKYLELEKCNSSVLHAIKGKLNLMYLEMYTYIVANKKSCTVNK